MHIHRLHDRTQRRADKRRRRELRYKARAKAHIRIAQHRCGCARRTKHIKRVLKHRKLRLPVQTHVVRHAKATSHSLADAVRRAYERRQKKRRRHHRVSLTVTVMPFRIKPAVLTQYDGINRLNRQASRLVNNRRRRRYVGRRRRVRVPGLPKTRYDYGWFRRRRRLLVRAPRHHKHHLSCKTVCARMPKSKHAKRKAKKAKKKFHKALARTRKHLAKAKKHVAKKKQAKKKKATVRHLYHTPARQIIHKQDNRWAKKWGKHSKMPVTISEEQLQAQANDDLKRFLAVNGGLQAQVNDDLKGVLATNAASPANVFSETEGMDLF